MIFPKIVMIIALISALTMVTGTQQTFAVVGGAGGGGSIRATTGAGGMGGGGSTGAGSIGQSVDPHLAEKICKDTGMETPLCK